MKASHRSRPVRDRLARLDEAVVPAAAERVSGALAALASARARAASALRGDEVRMPAEPAGGAQPAVLARLDARLARRGPLAVLRAVPGAGAALAALVALGGGLALLTLDEPAPDRLVAAATPEAGPAGVPTITSGAGGAAAPGAGPGGAGGPGTGPGGAPDPAPGTGPGGAPGPAADVPDTVLGPDDPLDPPGHLARAAADLALLPLTAPDTPVPALVHLAEHVTPQRAAELVAGVPIQQVVVRVPLGAEQTTVTTVPAQRLPDDAVAALAGLAGQLESRAAADETAAAASPPGDPAGDVLRASADLGRRQAAALVAGPDCACIVALLVTGTPGELAPLAARPGVLGVEPGPAGVPPEQLTLRPVLPPGAPEDPS